MKNTVLWAIALSALTLFLACKKNDTNPGSENCQISCKVDNVLYNVGSANHCTYLGNTLNVGQTGIDAIQLQVNNLSGTGTFNLADQSATIIITLTNGKVIGGLNGQVIVTELSASKATGTFSGAFYDLMDVTLTPNFTVTEGAFSVRF